MPSNPKPPLVNLDDLLPPALVAARKGKGKRTPPVIPPQLAPIDKYLPVEVVHFFTRTTCACGATYTGPTYAHQSTFLRLERFRTHAFGRPCRPYRMGDRRSTYRQLHGPAEAADLPHTTTWTEDSILICPSCPHRSSSQLSLDLGAPYSPVEFATKAHYAHLLGSDPAAREPLPSVQATGPTFSSHAEALNYIGEPVRQAEHLRSLGLLDLIDGSIWDRIDAYQPEDLED